MEMFLEINMEIESQVSAFAAQKNCGHCRITYPKNGPYTWIEHNSTPLVIHIDSKKTSLTAETNIIYLTLT